MKWLKNSLPFLILVLCFLVLIDIAIRFWFWSELNLVFNPENFNNILTPSAAFLSLVILGYLAYWQNKTTISHNLKEQFLSDIADVNTLFAKKVGNPPESTFEQISLLYSIILYNGDDEYLTDVKDIQEGNGQRFQYYAAKEYWHDIYAIGLMYRNGGLNNFYKVSELTKHFATASLINADRLYIRRRIEQELLGNYLSILSAVMDLKDGKPAVEGNIIIFEDSKPIVKNIGRTFMAHDYRVIKGDLYP